ncbi:Arb2 domain-containing protein [Stagonosporopsis vannaccii]|nr:Arb2 domain-containing protein [Stagonosporopsis vannaccii]
MFRRKEDTIAPDAYYPANLKELGFFINQVGHIRMIDAPEKPFVFNATNIERHNEVRNEALHACSRAEVIERMSNLGIRPFYFPQLAPSKPDGPHIPILAPPEDVLNKRKRIVVIINDSLQDLGILAYRLLHRELGLNGGSVVNFVNEMVRRSALSDTAAATGFSEDGTRVKNDSEIPGVLVMNTGQLLYSHKHNRCMTTRSWYALPRKSIAHGHVRIHEEENYLEGHRSPTQHVKSVFDQVLCNPDRVSPDAEVYIIAIESGASYILDVFKSDFEKYGARITAMAMVQTSVEDLEVSHPSLKALLHQRTRQWKFTDSSMSPAQCTELPNNYSPAPKPTPLKDNKAIRWNEEVPHPVLCETQKTLHHLALSAVPTNGEKSKSPHSTTDISSDWGSGSVPCPTFAAGREPTGECIFTQPAVQDAILSFFEDVAQDPENYRNPAFSTLADIPRPTADAPLIFDADATIPHLADSQTASHMLTHEQLELKDAHATLAEMRIALGACPKDVEMLAKGRARLVEKIVKQEAAVKDLQVKALGSGSLGVGEAEDIRQDWRRKVDGPRVPFAGTMVDSELLKAAGLGETADEELGEVDEDKTFV